MSILRIAVVEPEEKVGERQRTGDTYELATEKDMQKHSETVRQRAIDKWENP